MPSPLHGESSRATSPSPSPTLVMSPGPSQGTTLHAGTPISHDNRVSPPKLKHAASHISSHASEELPEGALPDDADDDDGSMSTPHSESRDLEKGPRAATTHTAPTSISDPNLVTWDGPDDP